MFCVVLDLVGSDCGSVCSWQVFYGKQGGAQGREATGKGGRWEGVYWEDGVGGLDTSTRLADPRRVILDALPAYGHAQSPAYEGPLSSPMRKLGF